jgi:Rrf2 family transcriptional regulator, iron-sulfur cluster assembly transcription factor
MKLTTKGRYAVTAMLDLALHERDGAIALSDIAMRQDISLAYLEQLFGRLRKAGLVHSMRGPGGGYSLALPADAIVIADVIEAVDERVDSTRCGGSSDCQNHERCLTHGLWEDLSEQIHGFLAGITLSELKSRCGVREVADRQDRVLKQMRLGATASVPGPH